MPDQDIVELPTLEEELARYQKLIKKRASHYFRYKNQKQSREDCVQKANYKIIVHYKMFISDSDDGRHDWPLKSSMVYRYVYYAAMEIFSEQRRHNYSNIDNIPEPSTKPQEHNIYKDIENILEDPRDRFIFIKRLDGYSMRDIADQLNISHVTVFNRIEIIRGIVAEYLKGD